MNIGLNIVKFLVKNSKLVHLESLSQKVEFTFNLILQM